MNFKYASYKKHTYNNSNNEIDNEEMSKDRTG